MAICCVEMFFKLFPDVKFGEQINLQNEQIGTRVENFLFIHSS